jgi:hypothetical protein
LKGKIKMKTMEYMYCVFLTAFGKGYGCFVIDKTDFQNGEIRMAASFCNPNDRYSFSKEQARKLAESKLSDPAFVFTLCFDQNDDVEDLESNEELADMYFEAVALPKWVQRCVDRNAVLFTLKQENLSLEQLASELDVSHYFFQDLRTVCAGLPARELVEYVENLSD